MEKLNTRYKIYWLVFLVICCLYPLSAEDNRRDPIDINLIIDGSQAFSDTREEITSWICSRLDQIVAEGDRVTVWNAGSSASIVYSGKIGNGADTDALKLSIRELSASGDNPDFSGALRQAASQQQQSSAFSYTMLVSASAGSLTSFLEGPQANLLRISRVEEFPAWRVLIVGLNLDTKIRRAATAFFGS